MWKPWAKQLAQLASQILSAGGHKQDATSQLFLQHRWVMGVSAPMLVLCVVSSQD